MRKLTPEDIADEILSAHITPEQVKGDLVWFKIIKAMEAYHSQFTDQQDELARLEREISYIKRNLEKVNDHTWKVYKEQALAHIEDAEHYINTLIKKQQP